ncbi:hypothetical protein AZE42_09807 [Rhizopogon vesiculosus]|uniref:Uncharacterized protein n=1 Tax=Rhizopogon vesiculosus TaxID=180088 RepID=A0A1J8QTW2_9AGAM|nr:hypothetical protein AZE42_09807 [Rhizopogon vesiculosus]
MSIVKEICWQLHLLRRYGLWIHSALTAEVIWIPTVSRNHARIRNPNLARYAVQSYDLISDLRINVASGGLRQGNMVQGAHNHTSTICWTNHKPKRGWYIHLRTPSFLPGVSISLLPMARSSPRYIDAALFFSCRTNALPDLQSSSSTSKMSEDSMSTVHSYSPTPPAASIVITPHSPQSVKARLEERLPSFHYITETYLAPSSNKNIAILIDAVCRGTAARTRPDVVYHKSTIDIFKQSTFAKSVFHAYAIQPQLQSQSTQCGKSDVTDYSGHLDALVDLP